MIFCLYLVLPFIASALEKFPKRYVAIPVFVTFIVCMVLPVLNQFLRFQNLDTIPTVLNKMNLPSVYMVYIFMGFCLSKNMLAKFNDWAVLILFITSFGSACYYQYYAYSMPENYLVEYQSPAFLLSAKFLLEIFKRNYI